MKHKLKLIIPSFLVLINYSCNHYKTNKSIVDKENHGYNELANPDDRKSFTISVFNYDNPEIENISRPEKSTIDTKLDTKLLFDMWTNDPNGPHADFELSDKYFVAVDYDGNGDMPYELIDNKLKIYYNDFIQEGKIISVDKDTLKILWNDSENINSYLKWTQ